MQKSSKGMTKITSKFYHKICDIILIIAIICNFILLLMSTGKGFAILLQPANKKKKLKDYRLVSWFDLLI